MHVIFVEPRFPANQRQFVGALKAAGAYVTGIGEAPVEALGPELHGWLDAYEQVPNVCDEGRLYDAVRRVQRRGPWVDLLEATVEAHILPVARVREACSIPGSSVRTAFLCRDKPAMKEALRQAGVPTAQSTGAASLEEAHGFASRIGFPLVVKPRSGAGAAGTHRVDDPGQLDQVLRAVGVGQGASVALEEFVEGHEGFFDTLCLGGEIVHHFVSHYYPNVLEAMRHRWISPQVVATNRVDAPGYRELEELGGRVIRALDIGTSATHMEWFFGPRGLKFSEIGCRPPGVLVWDLYGAANEMDVYREWAHLLVHGRPSQRSSRRFAAGMIALRPDRDGHVTGYEGVDEVQRRIGEWVLDAHFPPPGTPTQPVEGGYMANAWVRLRHPDYDRLRELLDYVGQTIKAHAA
ncbi:MAG TPA: ATP-grasp domain-containing protein [Thermoanaerobaculia bacterium]|nr:ATP-grasp domain-containing protein [Thermoanaerobaculia bacterium]